MSSTIKKIEKDILDLNESDFKNLNPEIISKLKKLEERLRIEKYKKAFAETEKVFKSNIRRTK